MIPCEDEVRKEGVLSVDERITAITSRHIGRCLSQLEEAGTPAVCLAAVKREFWFLADDIKQVIREEQEGDYA